MPRCNYCKEPFEHLRAYSEGVSLSEVYQTGRYSGVEIHSRESVTYCCPYCDVTLAYEEGHANDVLVDDLGEDRFKEDDMIDKKCEEESEEMRKK